MECSPGGDDAATTAGALPMNGRRREVQQHDARHTESLIHHTSMEGSACRKHREIMKNCAKGTRKRALAKIKVAIGNGELLKL